MGLRSAITGHYLVGDGVRNTALFITHGREGQKIRTKMPNSKKKTGPKNVVKGMKVRERMKKQSGFPEQKKWNRMFGIGHWRILMVLQRFSIDRK